jgi:primosomal protein N' (replication factor Y)
MYIQVRLLKGFQELLWYKAPEKSTPDLLIGSIVRVPFRNKVVPAVVESCCQEEPAVSFALKTAISCEPFPNDALYRLFIEHLAHYYQIPAQHLVKRMRQFFVQKEVKEGVQAIDELSPTKRKILLTDEQQRVVNFLCPRIEKGIYAPTVLHGVTGSGKTEVYKRLIEQTIACKKTALLLLPEVTLAVRFAALLKQELSSTIALFSFHSAVSRQEKRILWKKLIAGDPVLIIGVHLPILLPIAKMGLIIVDEEHEIGYQEKKYPKINSKEAALLRAKLLNIPIVLGSATPSIATLYNVKMKKWHFFQLKKRFSGAFPQIRVVSLVDKKQRKNFWLSPQLEQALRDRLQKGEQSIIFLNRRGYSFFVQCKQCSFIIACKNCSVSLTLHESNRLLCHYCGDSKPMPEYCFSCKADQKELLKRGIGTQQFVSILQKILPDARIGRADLDTTINKKNWQKIVDEFSNGSIDILVGTQTITKGYHFPKVTLVGIVWADLNLHFPIYNATETTLQQLIQVAGRAGRERQDSLVIVQTMMEHSIFQYLSEIDYLNFYAQELEIRRDAVYPPIVRLAQIELKHEEEDVVNKEAITLFGQLSEDVLKNLYQIQILGPSLPPVHKIKNAHIRKIYLKGPSIESIISLYKSMNKEKFQSDIFLVVNPLS